MVKNAYIPDRGDIVSLQFNPQSGKEQAGRRPALVLSPKKYNEKVGLMLCCPITSMQKGYPFEVQLPKNTKTTGVVLSDHIKNLDFKARKCSFIEKLPKTSLESAVCKVLLLLQ